MLQLCKEHAEYKEGEKTNVKTFQFLPGARMISHRDGGVDVYYDGRHRIIRTRLSGGGLAELVQELQADGSYRDQMLSINNAPGTVIDYPTPSKPSGLYQFPTEDEAHRMLRAVL